MRRVAMGLLTLAVAAGLMSCVPEGTTSQALPDGVEVHLDQSRMLRKTRTVFVRVHNGSDQPLLIERFVLASPRFDSIEWTGEENVGAGYDTDLLFEMPRGRCGAAIDAQLTLTYRVGDDRFRSVAKPPDLYGAATAFLDRDCAELTVRDAAAMDIGEPQIDRTSDQPVLELPVTFTPTGRRDDVEMLGFGSTVLFALDRGTTQDEPIWLVGDSVTVGLRLVPNRCDAHALADDKVGTLIPVKVRSADLPAGADGEFYLPIGKRRREALFTYYREACGLS